MPKKAAFDPPTHPVVIGQVFLDPFIVHEWGWVFLREHLKNVHFKFYSQFYMECEIEFDSLGLKFQECFNKSLTVVFKIEIAFV